VLVFGAILVLCWTTGKYSRPSVAWLIAAVAGFIALAVVHRRVLRAKNVSDRAARFYEAGQARVEDRWAGSGESGEQFAPANHVYAEDLDIFGQGSLFQLLCIARTRLGKERLAQWLLTQSPTNEILARQQAVAELSAKRAFREALALAGESDSIQADAAKLKRWATTHVAFNGRVWWPAVGILVALNLATLTYAIYGLVVRGDGFWTPFLVMLVASGCVLFGLRHSLQSMFAGLDEASHNLDALSALVRCIEAEQFTSPLLTSLQMKLFTHGLKPSRCIARLDTLCDLEDSRHNQMVQLLELPLLYSVQVALVLQQWRRNYGEHIPEWLEAVADFEALHCLATYAYEHPEDIFPQLSSQVHPARFEAEELGHPLLPAASCVRNDVSLGGEAQILLVSGSNMSGKSTLLRAVGVNAVLAMAGAPVRAGRLSISPVSIAASMRISDSLQKGVSHFYAEITRIRDVVALSAGGPLLFLLDEILQGTNSHDRRVGAEGILKTLLRNDAIGLATTHDLALTSLAEISPRIVNVHFQEKLEAGTLSFDYRLRSGVVTTSNGVELMKSVGLDV
jgi:hypothetical protein